MFLLRKPNVLFAFFEMRFICVSHDRFEEMSTPRYFAEDTDSSMQIVKSILCRNWVFRPCYVNDLAFRAVKFHVPFMNPAFKVVKIFLENL